MRARLSLLAMALVVNACSSTSTSLRGAADDAGQNSADAAAVTALAGEDCRMPSRSNLDGVAIRFTASPLKCTFTLAEAAAGIDVPYEIAVANDVPDTTANVHACTGPDASGLAPYESLAGGGQRYAIDDTGLCAPQGTTPVTIKAGTYARAFHWDGRNWSGPSDYGAPKGAAFPPGAYVLTVDVAGARNGGADAGSGTAYDVAAQLHVQIVP